MNRSSIYTTALALALAICTSDGRAQQRSPSTPSTSPPSTTTPSTSPGGQQRQPSQSQTPSQQQSTQTSGTMTVQSFVQEAATSSQKEIDVSRLATTRAQNEDVKDFAEELVEDHTEALEKLREYASEKGITLRTTTSSTSPTTSRPTQPSTSSTRPPTPSTPPSTQPQTGRNGPSTTQPGQSAQTERDSSSQAGRPSTQAETGSSTGDSSTAIRELSAKAGSQFDMAYIQMMIDDHQKAVTMFERQQAAKLGDSDLQDFIEDQVPVLRKHLNKARDIQKDLKEDSSAPAGSAPSRTPNR